MCITGSRYCTPGSGPELDNNDVMLLIFLSIFLIGIISQKQNIL